MPGYYRAIFTISKPDTPSSQVLADAWQCVQDWPAAEYGNPVRQFVRSSVSDDMKLCNRVHRYTDSSSCDWRLSVRLATDGNAVEADIELRATDSDDPDLSLNLMAQPPSVIQTLIEQFDCSVGADSLNINATRINPDEADSFVKNELLNEDRLLPLLVVTDPRNGNSVIDADEMQQELAGLARVFAYDHSAAWNVMRDLPQSLWCYDGAVRLFAPGCSEDDLAQQHPFWTPWRLGGFIRDNRLWQMLRDECLLRTPHQRQSRLLSRVENAINADDMKIMEDMVSRLEKTNPDAKDFLELLKFVDELSAPDYAGNYDISHKIDLVMSSITRVEYRNNKLKLENNDLREENVKLRAKLYRQADKSAPPNDVDIATEQAFSTILGCVEHAAQNLTHLRFLIPSARETAQSNYTRQYNARATHVYETFEVLNECGRQRTQPGGLGKNVQLWLKENRVEYSDESESTMREYSKERTFFDSIKGEHIPMPHHIKMLHNDIRIHLRWDADEKKFLIGYIGDHLPTAQDPH